MACLLRKVVTRSGASMKDLLELIESEVNVGLSLSVSPQTQASVTT